MRFGRWPAGSWTSGRGSDAEWLDRLPDEIDVTWFRDRDCVVCPLAAGHRDVAQTRSGWDGCPMKSTGRGSEDAVWSLARWQLDIGTWLRRRVAGSTAR